MLESKEIQENIRAKNNLIAGQTRRIKLLEEKMAELRKKYFQLKYPDVIIHLKSCI